MTSPEEAERMLAELVEGVERDRRDREARSRADAEEHRARAIGVRPACELGYTRKQVSKLRPIRTFDAFMHGRGHQFCEEHGDVYYSHDVAEFMTEERWYSLEEVEAELRAAGRIGQPHDPYRHPENFVYMVIYGYDDITGAVYRTREGAEAALVAWLAEERVRAAEDDISEPDVDLLNIVAVDVLP